MKCALSLAEFVAVLRVNRGGYVHPWIHGTGDLLRNPMEVTVRMDTLECFSSRDPAELTVLADMLRDLGRNIEADKLALQIDRATNAGPAHHVTYDAVHRLAKRGLVRLVRGTGGDYAVTLPAPTA